MGSMAPLRTRSALAPEPKGRRSSRCSQSACTSSLVASDATARRLIFIYRHDGALWRLFRRRRAVTSSCSPPPSTTPMNWRAPILSAITDAPVATTTAVPHHKDMNINRYIPKDTQPRTTRFDTLRQVLIEPALAIFLLLMTAIFMLVDTTRSLTVPQYRVPWYGYLFLGTAYALNRTRLYILAAGLTLSMVPLVVFATPWSDAPSAANTLHYLILGILLASIFLSIRGLAIIASVNVVGVLLLPILAPVAIPNFAGIVTPLAINTIGAALALVFMQHRDQIERGRQAELHASGERLRLALDAAHMGTWDWDIPADTITWSEQVAWLFGRPTGACPATQAAYLGHIHPSDRSAVAGAPATTLAGRCAWPVR